MLNLNVDYMKTRTSVDWCSYLSRALPAIDKETASLYSVRVVI